jgi:hypothetical protein
MPEQIIVPGAEPPLSVAVTHHGTQVVLHFSAPREFVAFTGYEPVVIGTQILCRAIEANSECAAKVIDMCMAIMDYAYEARGDLKPAGGAVKHELIERHRRTLTQRLAVVMNSTREKRTISNKSLARQLVDIMLKEVLS